MEPYQRKIVTEYCKEHKEIVALYLFGSYAADKQKVQSDVDLALLLDNEYSAFDLLDCIVSLERRLKLPVDALILNGAGEAVKFQVRLHGVLLYERDEKLRKAFEVRSRKYYEDFLYLHKRYSSKVLYGGKSG